MDAIVKPAEDQFLPALAEELKIWFPDVGNRAAAVSEIAINKENIPTLPLILCAFLKTDSEQLRRSHSEEFTMVDTFVVELWMEPNRIKRPDNSETPFWSYYPYEAIRNVMLNNMAFWVGPPPFCQRPSFRTLTIEADTFAVVMSFTFTSTFQWSALPRDSEGEPIKRIGFRLCTPAACIPAPCFEQEEECNPCEPSSQPAT